MFSVYKYWRWCHKPAAVVTQPSSQKHFLHHGNIFSMTVVINDSLRRCWPHVFIGDRSELPLVQPPLRQVRSQASISDCSRQNKSAKSDFNHVKLVVWLKTASDTALTWLPKTASCILVMVLCWLRDGGWQKLKDTLFQISATLSDWLLWPWEMFQLHFSVADPDLPPLPPQSDRWGNN